MSILSFSFRKQTLAASKLLDCFSNVTKLKNKFLKISLQNHVCSRNLIKPCAFKNVSSPKLDVLCGKNLFRIHVIHSIRWTRCSKTGYFINNAYAKKKKTQFAEEVKLKFQSSKLRETKKRFKRKIVEIKENILTIPNGLCALRIVSTPVLAYLIISEYYAASLGLFIFAGFTDLIDGFIARNFPNQQTMIGSFLDPAADKLLISTLFISLTVNGLIPVPLTTIIILRDACLFSAGFYIRYVSLPPPKTLSRYFDMSFATAKLQPTAISKANTVIQLCLAATSLAAPVFSFVDHSYLHALWYITGTTTVLSAASYIYYNKETYKLYAAAKKDGNSIKK